MYISQTLCLYLCFTISPRKDNEVDRIMYYQYTMLLLQSTNTFLVFLNILINHSYYA